jgi:hypothetical protein
MQLGVIVACSPLEVVLGDSASCADRPLEFLQHRETVQCKVPTDDLTSGDCAFLLDLLSRTLCGWSHWNTCDDHIRDSRSVLRSFTRKSQGMSTWK